MQAPEISISAENGTQDRGYGAGAPGIMVSPVLQKKFRKFSGYAICFGVFLAILALASWNAADPSLTFANGKDSQNWLGYSGASFSDLAMQFFGFASLGLLVPPLVWGLFKITGRPLSQTRYRMGAWLFGLLCLSASLGCIAVPSGWPLPVGLGGVVGDAVLNIPAAFTGSYPSGIFAVLLGLLFIVPGVYLLVRASDLHNGLPAPVIGNGAAEIFAHDQMLMERELPGGFDENLDQGRDWSGLLAAPLGLLFHWGYSARASLRKYTGKPAAAHQAPQQIYAEAPQDVYGNSQPPQWVEEPIPYDVADDGSMGAPTQETGFDDGTMYADEGVDPTQPQVLTRERVAAPEMLAEPPVPHTDAAQPVAPELTNRVATRTKPKAKNGKYILPALELLSEARTLVQDATLSPAALEANARALEGVLDDFGVKGQIIQVRPGPVVTLYELEPAPGIKSSRVIGLADDIARSMSAIAARVAVVPGRNAIGIELPNKKRETVYLREQLSSAEFAKSKAKLPMCLGKTIGGEPVIADMAKMPHLLVAGTTGSGKSVAINTMILSLLYKHGPDRCKLIMIDPKMLELSIYDGIPHLLTPVVVDPKKAVVALKWTVREMEERYKKMSKVGVRNIDGFNTRVEEAAKKGEVIQRTVQTGFDRETGEAIYETEELDLEVLPYIVVVIDEMADLMMVAGKDIEGTVQRLAQMARAAGIHVIMATQRPSTDVITGTIKANFPTRISFQVTSKIDSRVMLGESGAEQLLGMGDMLYMAGGGRITRVHGPFVDDQEVEDVVNHLKTQGVPQYLESITEEEEESVSADGGSGGAGGMGDSDDPYDKAVAIVLRDRKASTSYIQRRLSVGYNKAATLIERMEQEGLISPANHAGKREILVPAEDEML